MRQIIQNNEAFELWYRVGLFDDDQALLAKNPNYMTYEMTRRKYRDIQLVPMDATDNPAVLRFAVNDGNGNPVEIENICKDEFYNIKFFCELVAQTTPEIVSKFIDLPTSPKTNVYINPPGRNVLSIEISRSISIPGIIGRLNNGMCSRLVLTPKAVAPV